MQELFAAAGCRGQFCVQSLDRSRELAESADAPVVAASVIKVLIALAAENAFADGHLDATEQVRLPAAPRTPGPTGFSLFHDDAQASLRDLVIAMMTISDNVAADALLACVGLDECNAFARQLGLRDTVIVSDLRTTVDSIAQDADFADWQALSSWSEAATPAADAEVTELIRRSRALSPKTANRTTPRDMCELLRAIWTDRAGPPKACQRVRTHMAKQLTRNRIAAGFAPPVRVAAKSGGLMGVVRNEVAAISTASGEVYLATVFTQAQPGASESDINHAIGQVAAAAVRELS